MHREIRTRAWEAFKENWLAILLCSIITGTVAVILTKLATLSGIGILSVAVNILMIPFAYGHINVSIQAYCYGNASLDNYFAIWSDKEKLKKVFALGLILVAIQAVLGLLGSIPVIGIAASIVSVVLSVYTALAYYIICFDGSMEPADYIKLSIQCMKGHFWSYIGFIMLNVGLPMFAVTIIFVFISFSRLALLFAGLVGLVILIMALAIWSGLLSAGFFVRLIPPYMVTGIPEITYTDSTVQ